MTPFAIAGIQMYLSAVQDNVPRMKQRLNVVMHLYPWVQMVVFSELAPKGPLVEKAEPIPGPTEQAFQEMARHHGIWLLPGSMYEKAESGNIYNTTSIINPDGEVIGRYRKMFPFMPYEAGVEPGDDFFTFDVPEVGRFGVSICYDIWFPETTRQLAAMGCEVLLHPTLTGTIDREVELNIIRAAAACNQMFVVDVNGLGDGGLGRSLVVGPAGDVLHQAGEAAEAMPIEIDLDRVRRGREVGVRGLGQPLKSFRDHHRPFPVYESGHRSAYLDSLGPLAKPTRGSKAGLHSSASSSGPPETDDPPDH